MDKRYLVQSKYDNGEVFSNLLTQSQIINKVNMRDCSCEEMEIFDISEFGEIKKLKVFGCWHNPKNPLYIKVENEYGETEFDGYGTDH